MHYVWESTHVLQELHDTVIFRYSQMRYIRNLNSSIEAFIVNNLRLGYAESNDNWLLRVAKTTTIIYYLHITYTWPINSIMRWLVCGFDLRGLDAKRITSNL